MAGAAARSAARTGDRMRVWIISNLQSFRFAQSLRLLPVGNKARPEKFPRRALSGFRPAPPVGAQRGVKHMRAPAAVDLKIALRHALVFEAACLQKPARGHVLGQAG